MAHQDYTIHVVETPDTLLFTNLGSFIPGSLENSFFAQAMVNLNMIDTIRSGIKTMFIRQRERNFPMPDYELEESEKVVVRLIGQVHDENYTRCCSAARIWNCWM